VAPGIELNEHAEADGAAVFRQACKMGLEGIVSAVPGDPDHPFRLIPISVARCA
jgi:ATP-dependent DNA ligase